MSSVIDKIKCPKCGYEYAQYIYMCRTLDEHVICARCGYCGSYERDIYASKESGEPVWHHKEIGGSGSCVLKQKGHLGYIVGSMEDFLKSYIVPLSSQ